MESELDRLKRELELQKDIAYTAGLLQGDITIRTLFESLAEGAVVINHMGRIVYTNRRLQEIFGYTKDELQGEPMDILIPQRLRSAHLQHIKKYFSQPRIRPMGIGVELAGLSKSKEEIPIEVSLSFLEVETGRLGLAFISDITTRKLAESELREKNKQLDEFAQIVAHDLNSNLNSLVGFSELLLDPECKIDDLEKADMLKQILFSGRKMSEIVRELLMFARISKEDLQITNLEMDKYVHSAVDRLKHVVEEKSAVIKIESLDGYSKGYGPWIEEVWFNYISNALNYAGDSPVITIGSIDGENEINYFVSDNGPGLSEDAVKVLFDDSNPSRKKYVKGLGIGLTIAKNITQKLDGKVGVRSKPNEETTFYFSLPKGD